MTMMTTIAAASSDSAAFADFTSFGWVAVFINAGAIGVWALFYFLRRIITPQEMNERLEAEKKRFDGMVTEKDNQIQREKDSLVAAIARSERLEQERERDQEALTNRWVPLVESSQRVVQEASMLLHDAMEEERRRPRGTQ